ncbi:MAG: helix-turn-helix transcriptional regulator [Stenotrophobium sp.]
MSDALQRQWVMLRLLPRAPRTLGTREVWERLHAQGYKVTKRTVERDLDTLSTQFGYTSESRDGATRWFWPKDAALLDVPGLEPTAALALLLAREQLSPLLPASTLQMLRPYFLRAEAVLDEGAGNPLGKWRKKVRALSRGPALRVPKVKAEVNEAVSEALLRSRQLNARYRARGEEISKEQILNPLGLVAKDGVIYLVATAWKFENPVHYALHRFDSAVMLDEQALKPRGFDLDRYLSETAAFQYPLHSEHISLVADFDADAAEHLIERPLSVDQIFEQRPDGRARITATVADTAELRWWLRGYGELVEIIKPQDIRTDFSESAKSLNETYKS